MNLEVTLSLIRRLRRARPDARMICMASPVPLMATFFGHDILISDMHSRCTIRSVLTEAVQLEADRGAPPIDYVPALELVMLNPRKRVWREKNPLGAPDGRHVREDFIANVIVEYIEQRYVTERPERPKRPCKARRPGIGRSIRRALGLGRKRSHGGAASIPAGVEPASKGA
jgi:hypothetical protein